MIYKIYLCNTTREIFLANPAGLGWLFQGDARWFRPFTRFTKFATPLNMNGHLKHLKIFRNDFGGSFTHIKFPRCTFWMAEWPYFTAGFGNFPPGEELPKRPFSAHVPRSCVRNTQGWSDRLIDLLWKLGSPLFLCLFCLGDFLRFWFYGMILQLLWKNYLCWGLLEGFPLSKHL